MRGDDAMTLLEMQRKIELLEKQVRELEARPQQVHYHYSVKTPADGVYSRPWWMPPEIT